MRIIRTNVAFAMQVHEPLWPIAVRILIAEQFQQERPNRFELPDPEEVFNRTLSHVAGSPASPGVLLETSGREVMNQGVVCEPRQDFSHLLKRRIALWRHAEPRSRSTPVAIGIGHSNRRIDLDQLPFNLKPRLTGCRGDRTNEGLASGDPVREKKRIIADRFKNSPGQGINLKSPFRETATYFTVR